ncbi:MAG: winged helix DNA-binding protein [Clostridiales bacterium]|nr:winged helix DNA-binding protein [Clostridiales bacterium]
MENENKKSDILELSNELTVRRYLFNKDHVNRILSIPDYIALHIIKETEHLETIYAGRTYLKDLAEKMQLSIRQTSRMVGNLKDRGLVKWSHDGDGREGTYVTITESGEEILKKQENILKDYYGKVIQQYGEDNLIQLLHMMKQLETVMHSQLEGMEVSEEDDREIE